MSVLSIEEAARLHGHLGPWLVLGYRIGLRALEILEARHSDLLCTAYLPLKTPYTCALDGIQASTGCTLGKLNLKVNEYPESDINFVFERKDNRKKVVFKLKEGVPTFLRELIDKLGVEEAAKKVLSMNLQEVVIEMH